MSIDIPAGYDATNINEGEGVSTGKAITAKAMETIAKNNNFMWGRYNGPLAHSVFGDAPRGKSTQGDRPAGAGSSWPAISKAQADYEDLCVYAIPGDAGQRPYMIHMYVEHTDVTKSDGNIKLRIAGSDVSTVTIPAGSALAVFTSTFANPVAATRDLVVQVDSYYVRVHSIALTRKRFDGSSGHADDPTAAPFHFMQDSSLTRLKATEPLTDEWINRGTNNINRLVSTQRHSLACVTMPIKNETTVQRTSLSGDGLLEFPVLSDTHDSDTTDTPASYYIQDSQYPIGVAGMPYGESQIHFSSFPLVVKYAQTLSVFSCFFAPPGVTMRIHITDNVKITGLSPNYTSLPTTGDAYTFTETQVEVTKGSYNVFVYFDEEAAKNTARLFSLSVVGE